MILNELCDFAVNILISDVLPGSEIEQRLIESPAEALCVLRDKARHEAADDDGREQLESVDQAAYEAHEREASDTPSDITPALAVRAQARLAIPARGKERRPPYAKDA
jgi:hypothetical protein